MISGQYGPLLVVINNIKSGMLCCFFLNYYEVGELMDVETIVAAISLEHVGGKITALAFAAWPHV